jgi:hypothetical protein
VSSILIHKTGKGYRVIKNDYDPVVYAATLELALNKAIQQAGIEGVELAPTLQAAEVLESLLGASE